eukprot:Opistho-2@46964
MMEVLFCYTKLHPELSYRQGMHELLAPIIQILDCEKIGVHDGDEVMRCILSETHIPHDAFSLFSRLMGSTREWFAQGDDTKTPRSSVPQSPALHPLGSSSNEEVASAPAIVTKLRRIQHVLLKEVDHDLYLHLLKMEIEPQIYGLRWLRLLFGREFHLDDVLVLWDAIFADGSHFEIVDYICVSMLTYIRQQLLHGDYVTCLKRLMKYPPVEDVRNIIEKAQRMRTNHINRAASPVPKSRGSAASSSGGSSQPQTPTLTSTSFASAFASTSTRNSPGTRRQSAGTPGGANKSIKVSDIAKPVSTFVNFIGNSFRSVTENNASSSSSAGASGQVPPPSGADAKHVRNSIDKEPSSVVRPQTPSRAEKGVSRQKSATGTVGASSSEETEQRLREIEAMNKACARRIQRHLKVLEAELLKGVTLSSAANSADPSALDVKAVYLAIAGIKHTKDILYGNLPFDAAVEFASDPDIDADADADAETDASAGAGASAGASGGASGGAHSDDLPRSDRTSKTTARSLFGDDDDGETVSASDGPAFSAAAIDPLGALLA